MSTTDLTFPFLKLPTDSKRSKWLITEAGNVMDEIGESMAQHWQSLEVVTKHSPQPPSAVENGKTKFIV